MTGTRGSTSSTTSFDFDGRPVPFSQGQTVGAALWADGVRSWRRTRFQGRPRGLFCGIGVCFDCVLTVNGVPDVRACRRRARDGDTITTQSRSMAGER